MRLDLKKVDENGVFIYCGCQPFVGWKKLWEKTKCKLFGFDPNLSP